MTGLDESLAKLRARGITIAGGTVREAFDGRPVGCVWVADTTVNGVGYVARENVVSAIVTLYELLDEDEADELRELLRMI